MTLQSEGVLVQMCTSYVDCFCPFIFALARRFLAFSQRKTLSYCVFSLALVFLVLNIIFILEEKLSQNLSRSAALRLLPFLNQPCLLLHCSGAAVRVLPGRDHMHFVRLCSEQAINSYCSCLPNSMCSGHRL